MNSLRKTPCGQNFLLNHFAYRSSVAKALTTLGHPRIAVMCSSMFGKIGVNLQEFLDNKTQFSLSLKIWRQPKKWQELRRNKLKPNFSSARLPTLRLFVILLCFVTFRSELKEYIPDNEIMRYVYYNKIGLVYIC